MEMLKMTNISKSFYGVKVLNHVDFSVKKGEVHALLGENGAGKSTLMNILAGIYTKDSGTVTFDGKPLKHTTVQLSENAGIAFVHQELNLFNDLKVYENIFLRKEPINRFGFLDKKQMIAKTQELFSSLDVELNPEALVADLETSKKQLLEIAKALFANAKLFILDEPTTALTNQEITHLFAIVNRLKQEGKSFIFISHKMDEIFTIADRFTVLRNGEFIHTGNIKDTTPQEAAKLMVGSSYSDNEVYEQRELGNHVLEFEHFSGIGFHDISLKVRKGEVIGLTGLKGAGISELMGTAFGALPILGGTLKIRGKEIENNRIHTAMKNGLVMLPANRKENSVIPEFTLLENNYISEHTLSSKHPVIDYKTELKKYNQIKKALNIKANSPTDLITSLSGGNQQKIILGRWLNTNPEILLMDNPTQGIDVGAKSEIYKLILKLAKDGKTILINTLEIPEVMKVADRCVIFYHGQIQKILEREEITEQTVMLYATNAINAVEETKSYGNFAKQANK